MTNIRFIVTSPTVEQLIKFKVKIDDLQGEILQREINQKLKFQEINTKIEGPSENIVDSADISEIGVALPSRPGKIHGSGQSPKKIFENLQSLREKEEKKITLK